MLRNPLGGVLLAADAEVDDLGLGVIGVGGVGGRKVGFANPTRNAEKGHRLLGKTGLAGAILEFDGGVLFLQPVVGVHGVDDLLDAFGGGEKHGSAFRRRPG